MTWNVDKAHSELTFRVRHMVIAKVSGTFGEWDADLRFDPDRIEDSQVVVRVNTASVDTREADRDAHLRSPDFFHVEEHPELVFRSTRIETLGKDKMRVWGELTIKGVTKEIALETSYSGRLKDPWGNDRIGFEATTEIDRKDFGLVWNAALETGGLLVGDKVQISLDLEATAAAE
ncbi:MAG: YceI family protein [Thermoleophilia bacterium]